MCWRLFNYVESKKNPRVELSISTVEETVDGPEIFKITLSTRDTIECFGYTNTYTIFSNTRPSIISYVSKNYSTGELFKVLDHMYYELQKLIGVNH